MERSLIFSVPLLLLFVGPMACGTDSTIAQDTTGTKTNANNSMGTRLRIRVASATFTATLLDNPTVTAFKKQLPITLSMQELNKNEKFADLPNNLPTNAVNPGTIQTGDLMLYGSSTLVLFYETFRTSYAYTKLGRIDNPSGLAAALGSGDVTVFVDLE